jgi:hypothetical protein
VIVPPPNILKSLGPSTKAPAEKTPTGTVSVVELENWALMYPHSPKLAVKKSEAVTVPLGLVLFLRVSWALSPPHEVKGRLQGSFDPPEAGTGVLVGNTLTACAGVEVSRLSGGTVLVGNGVLVGASVGGMGVAVGIAACVSATIVIAAAMAVPWTSSGDIVGSGVGPQALNTSAAIANIIQTRFINCLFSKCKESTILW